jgi:MoaA/NifB/PqqE/SkfB family radical SAM enzyme
VESYVNVQAQMRRLYQQGLRILFFCGGESFLWRDGGKTLRDLVVEAKEIGFYLVNVVTNGTLSLRLPEADVVFVSIDGMKAAHDEIRGKTFDTIMGNIFEAKGTNLCVYMAINNRNYHDVVPLTQLVADTPHLKSISFNFHTPYRGTEALSLSPEQKRLTVDTIRSLIDQNYPIFNLKSALQHYLTGDWARPCCQCVVVERDKVFTCGRCVEAPGLCDECGYLFAVEFSLLLRGNVPAIWDMLNTYRKYT